METSVIGTSDCVPDFCRSIFDNVLADSAGEANVEFFDGRLDRPKVKAFESHLVLKLTRKDTYGTILKSQKL